MAAKMETLHKSRLHHMSFDISGWVDSSLFDSGVVKEKKVQIDGNGKVEMYVVKKSTPENTLCGYSACAVGHACLMPEFQEQGLHFSPYAAGRWNPVFDGESGMFAVELFFDIDTDIAEKLFTSDGYGRREATPKRVAKKIRKFIRKSS